jgi:signal peptidase I
MGYNSFNMKLSAQMKSVIKEIAITVGIALAIYLLFNIFIHNAVVHMSSMDPTLHEGQRLFALKRFIDPNRGDIIIIRPPVAPNDEFVKRLIGLPGDVIEVKNKQVLINGVVLYEPYISSAPNYTYGPFTVPAGNYFVLGDNRNYSSDSHFGWTITRDEIVGKALWRYWPFSKFGHVGNYNLNAQVESAAGVKSSAADFPILVAALPKPIEVEKSRGP